MEVRRNKNLNSSPTIIMGTPPVKIKPRGFESVREYLLFEESVEKELKFLTVCQTFQKRPEHCAAIAGEVSNTRVLVRTMGGSRMK